MNRTLLILPALAALALPGVSFAQTQQSITVNGTVAPACALGSPTNATLNLGALTGADGRLTTALAGAGIAAQTTINNAWCNTPNRITLTSSPLTLVSPPAYATPTNFTRTVAFQAALTGWSGSVVNKALTPNVAVPVDSTTAHVAAPLGIQFSSLSPVLGGAIAPSTTFIEAGDYSATVSITLAVN